MRTFKGKEKERPIRSLTLDPPRTPMKDLDNSSKRHAGHISLSQNTISSTRHNERANSATLDTFWGLSQSGSDASESTDGRTSPTPRAKKVLPAPKTRPQPRPVKPKAVLRARDDDVIVISSDSDEGATPHPPRIARTKKAPGRGVKRTSDPKEVIEID